MKGFDAFAGVIKSGGKTRRAAKMVILDVDHPDIVEFIDCKEDEEKKAQALIDAGYTGAFNVPGGAYDSVPSRTPTTASASPTTSCAPSRPTATGPPAPSPTASPAETYTARDLMRQIAEGTWVCGDPGMQYDTDHQRLAHLREHRPHLRQ